VSDGGGSNKAGSLTAKVCRKGSDGRTQSRSSTKYGLDHLVVVIDQTLGDNAKFMEEMVKLADSAGLQFCVANSSVAGSVRWVWSEAENLLDQAASSTDKMGVEGDEGFLLVSVDALEYARLVHYSNLVRELLVVCDMLLEFGLLIYLIAHTLLLFPYVFNFGLVHSCPSHPFRCSDN